jgi:hypothetical protein
VLKAKTDSLKDQSEKPLFAVTENKKKELADNWNQIKEALPLLATMPVLDKMSGLGSVISNVMEM